MTRALVFVAALVAVAFASCKSAPLQPTQLEFFADDKLVHVDADGIAITSGVGDQKRRLELHAGSVTASHEVVVTNTTTKATSKATLTLHPDKLALSAPQIHSESDGLSGALVPGPIAELATGDRGASLHLNSMSTVANISVDDTTAIATLRGRINALYMAKSGDLHMYANPSCVIVDSADTTKPGHASLCATKEATRSLEKTYNP
jgi:hypothetical protein